MGQIILNVFGNFTDLTLPSPILKCEPGIFKCFNDNFPFSHTTPQYYDHPADN